MNAFEMVSPRTGAFGTAYLEEDEATGEQVSIKYLPRGPKARRPKILVRGASLGENAAHASVVHRCTWTHLSPPAHAGRDGASVLHAPRK